MKGGDVDNLQECCHVIYHSHISKSNMWGEDGIHLSLHIFMRNTRFCNYTLIKQVIYNNWPHCVIVEFLKNTNHQFKIKITSTQNSVLDKSSCPNREEVIYFNPLPKFRLGIWQYNILFRNKVIFLNINIWYIISRWLILF